MEHKNLTESIEFPNQKIIGRNMEKEIKTSFIEYSMSVITSRALPDVRDGMKPVHRRILYAMHEDHITYDKPFKKSATTVGNVLGRYHPHGDAAVYQTMVRMAQNFSLRYPLIEGHGNFGNVDGDGAAAYRYTEARLAKLSDEMMSDIEKNVVDFVPNFDNSRKEPTVLPKSRTSVISPDSTIFYEIPENESHEGKSRVTYGFICDEAGNDVFVHYSGLVMEGFKSLEEGAAVEYEVVNGEKGPQAVNVVKL